MNRYNSVSPPFSIGRFLSGFVASGVVAWLFMNIQNISDMAPESIRNSDAPGALGVPVAILSIVWFAVIPILFVRRVMGGALGGRGATLPGPFVLGAFLGLAIFFAAIRLLDVQGPL